MHLSDIIQDHASLFSTLGCPKPRAVLGMEVTEHYQAGNGIVHRKAINVASQRIAVTPERGVRCMSRALEEGRGGQGQRVG